MDTTRTSRWISAFLLFGLIGCSAEPPPPRPVARPGPCALLAAKTPGPRSAEREALAGDAAAIAEIFLSEAKQTGDAGFHVLAEAAATCALQRAPDDPAAALLHATALYHSHRFAEAERAAQALTVSRGAAPEWTLLGDALMEQGRLDAAADAYQRAVDLSPEAALYDRIMYLRWLWGDQVGALEMAELAVSASTADPETHAWSLGWLGWLYALEGKPATALDRALALDPKQHLARLFRARVRLHQQDQAGALADLDATYTDFASLRIRREIDPSVDLLASCDLDPRGCAVELAATDPTRAKALIQREWSARQDAHTAAARAWVLNQDGNASSEAHDLARAALATGSIDPDVLYMAGMVLRDREVLQRALATGPGLLPSQRALAMVALSGR